MLKFLERLTKNSVRKNFDLLDKDKSIEQQIKDKKNRSILSKKIKSINDILDGLKFLEKKNFI